jgi:exopolyphosphatase/guanosine-5'-triphosphate,3'-diphosphate pyrophosphatase
MQAIIPRYEFRAFAQNFGLAEEKMRRLSKLDKFRESSEIYILSNGNNENNVKIRYDTLDIKAFVKEEKGLQQWKPRMRTEFPMKMEVLRDDVFPALGTAVPEFNRSEYTLEQFLEDILMPHPELVLARVFKRRFGYTINGCISEIAELLINGATIKTMALESADIETVLKVKQKLGLHEYENVNYLLAIKRILGMEPPGD